MSGARLFYASFDNFRSNLFLFFFSVINLTSCLNIVFYGKSSFEGEVRYGKERIERIDRVEGSSGTRRAQGAHCAHEREPRQEKKISSHHLEKVLLMQLSAFW